MGVYPQTALPVFVEIAPGAAAAGDPSGARFYDVTSSALSVVDQIDIGQGRGDWGQDADAGSCSLTFDNESGDFSEHNPMGQWFGQLGKDTPMRAGLRRVEDTFSRTSAATWTTSDSGHTWSGFGLGGSVVGSDFTVSGGLGRQSVPAVNAWRAARITDLSLLDCRVRLSGIKLPFTDVANGSVEPGNIALRVQDTNTYYLCRIEITMFEQVICRIYDPDGVELANKTVAGLTHSAAQTLEHIAEITGDVIRMKVWATNGTEPGAWTLTATDPSPMLAPGGIAVRTGVAAGNTNTLPIVATYDSVTVYADLAGVWVPAWVPRSDLSGKFRTVPVSGKGALYRLQPATGKSPELAPFRRTITGTPNVSKLLAYWPCEDLAGATRAASALPHSAPMTVTGPVTFADDPSAAGGSGFERDFTAAGFNRLIPPGIKSAANLGAGGRLTGSVPRLGTSSPVEWAVCFVARSNSLQAGKEILLMEWDCQLGGTYKTFRLYQQVGGTIELFGIDAVTEVGFSLGNWPDITVALTEYRIEAATAGSSATIRIWVDGDLKSNVTFSSTTLTRVTTVRANPLGTSVTGVTGFWMSTIQVWDTATPPALGGGQIFVGVADSYGQNVYPFFRYLNEAATDRLERLAAQDNVPMFIPPLAAMQVTRMGVQPDGPPLDLYRECEHLDGGVLYERPFALGYQPRAVLYAQPPALVLDVSDLVEAPAPDGTSQRYRNRWEVTRSTGSAAVAEAAEVALGAIVADESQEINAAVDGGLRDQASWRLHLVSGKGLRWPTLKLDMFATPQLLDQVLNLRPGSRITVANPPADVSDADIDVIFEGWTVTHGHKSMEITANCSPALPWNIGVRDDPATLRDTGGSQIAAAASVGATSISVATTTGPLWVTGAVNFDIYADGLRLHVTNITGAASPQTFTVNAIPRALVVGDPVRLWRPALRGL